MRWQRLLAIGLIVLGLILVGLFSTRTVISYSSTYWRQISRRSQTVNQL
jgi:hypothetical protein